MEIDPGKGYDVRAENRPGVPMELAPPSVVEQLGGPPPARSLAQPLHGLSGILRAMARRIPEHKARRWMTLLLADRVDVMESRVRDLFGRRPLFAVGVTAGVTAAALGITFLARRR